LVTVYVANLDWSVDEPQLYRIFGEVDGLKDVRLVKDFLKRSKGYAYIEFDTKAHVDEAVKKFNGLEINKRCMRVAPSLPTKPLFEEKTLFIKGIGAETTEVEVKTAFEKHGPVLSVRMPTTGEGNEKKHKGYAYVEFEKPDAIDVALAVVDMEIGGHKLEVARSIPMKDHRHHVAANRKDLPQRANQRQIWEGKLDREDPVRLSSQHSNTVHVKNLSFKVDDAALKEHFGQCGEVTQVLICRNDKGKSQGFGFVEFATSNDAQAALLMTDSVLKGRSLVVSKSQRAITQKKDKDGEEKDNSNEQDEEDVASFGKGGSKSKSKGSKGKDKGKGKGKDKGKDKGKGKGKAKGDAAPASGDAATETKSTGTEAFMRFAPVQKLAGKRRLDVGGPPPEAAAPKDAAEEEAPKKDGKEKLAFRDVKALKAAKAEGAPAAEASSAPAASAEAAPSGSSKPMSNADFRALLMQ